MNVVPTHWNALEDHITTCPLCPRLVAWREETARNRRRAYRDEIYWGKPVPALGAPSAHLLIVGLAPGAHGSNRTGRMFTGDASGEFLFPALFRAGFASQPSSQVGDSLELIDCVITAVCRCVPPDNKPTPAEMSACQPYLEAEMTLLPNLQGIVALGKIAFDAILRIYRQRGCSLLAAEFGHGAFYQFAPDLPWLLASYHPSRQNTQTGRLTAAMFDQIWQQARSLLSE
jgi:uracil-DNA glycosylase